MLKSVANTSLSQWNDALITLNLDFLKIYFHDNTVRTIPLEEEVL